MLKQNKHTLIIASLLTLLPIPLGFIFWEQLPDLFVTHWSLDGTAGGFWGKIIPVAVLPLVLFAIFWICVFFTAKDPSQKDQSKKPLQITFMIIPAISILTGLFLFTANLKNAPAPNRILPVLLGLIFIFIGNYLPKCKQNRTLGIKIKWTLESRANWDATHRFTGKVWFFGGFLMMLFCPLPSSLAVYLTFILLFLLIFSSVVYSFFFRRKEVAEGSEMIPASPYPISKKGKIFSAVALSLILIAVILIMFTGGIEIRYEEDSFTVDATYHSSVTVEYAAIEKAEFRKEMEVGQRTLGFSSPRLLLGTFQNEEFGLYTLYAKTDAEGYLVIRSGEKVLVIGFEDESNAKAVLKKLDEKISAPTTNK